jgi:hypothetical protein
LVKHIGFASKIGKYKLALKHLRDVNEMTLEEARTYIKKAYELHDRRSRHEWAVDIQYLLELVDVNANTDAARARNAAQVQNVEAGTGTGNK